MRRSLVVVMLLAACGGSIDLGDYRQAGIDARCEYLTRCGLWPDTQTCKAYFARITLDSPNPKAAVDAGKMKYDGEAAKQCFDALASASCLRATTSSDACDRVFAGTVANGGMCAFDRECVTNHCVVPACTVACCQGTCAPAKAVPDIGQACTFECVDGAYCGADGTCHASLPQGAACDSQLACVTGLACAGLTTTSTGVCSPLPKTGEPCTNSCANIGEYCATTCVADGLPPDPCTSDVQCSFYYHCDMTTMQCAERPSDPLMPNGSPCTSEMQCMSTYCGSDNTCADVPLCI